MNNSIQILLMVIFVNVCVLGVGAFALYRLNRAIDQFDHQA